MTHPLLFDLLNVSWAFFGYLDDSLLDENTDYEVQSVDSSSESQHQVKILHKLPIKANCLAAGVIRSVCRHDASIYVLAPLGNPESCEYTTRESNCLSPQQKVNFILIPNQVYIPSGLLNEQFAYFNASSLPYLVSK